MLKTIPKNENGSLYLLLPKSLREGYDIEKDDIVLWEIHGVEKKQIISTEVINHECNTK